ncbi:MAG: hypothetical protein JNJ77_04900 [Planctomycetia bacterium]|nr:hypothetical protein [Planctomycetia bacterium]
MGIFRTSLQYNDTYAFRDYPPLTENQRTHQELVPDVSGASHPGIHRCEICGELTSKWEEPLLGLVIKKRKYDISITYDGVLIISQKFKSACSDNNLSGLVFRQLSNDADFFAVQASKTVEFDAERRKTRFIQPCNQCGRYESVVGATPVFLKAGTEIDGREFVRTDLEFGSGDQKHPILICGEVAAKALSNANLKGLDLIPIKENVGVQN